MDVIWMEGGDLFVAGPDTEAHIFSSRPGRSIVGLRFAPGVGPSVLGVAAHELRDERVPLDAIWRPAMVRRLTDDLTASARPGRVLEAAAEAQLAQHGASERLIAEVVRLARSGRRVTDIAAAVGLSERQLRRRSLDAFGYGPKTLARILRLGRAVELASIGEAFATWPPRPATPTRRTSPETSGPSPGSRCPSSAPEGRQRLTGRDAKRSTPLPSGS